MSSTAIVCQTLEQSATEQVVVADLVRTLSERGVTVLVAPELYHVAEDSSIWQRLADLRGSVALFCRLHPRAAQWLMHRHGVGRDGLQVVDLRQHKTSEEALQAPEAAQRQIALRQAPEKCKGRVEYLEVPAAERWYPVADESRCTNCRHCLQFCIFGVYGQDDAGRVTVIAPDNCKPGCPACARICPNSAIMFPLYADDQAIAGAPGKLVELDAAARRMYYARTGAVCPECGQSGTGAGGSTPGGNACPECGRAVSGAIGASAAEVSEVHDEIDALIRELEDLSGGGR